MFYLKRLVIDSKRIYICPVNEYSIRISKCQFIHLPARHYTFTRYIYVIKGVNDVAHIVLKGK